MAPIKCGYYLPSAENVDIPPQYFTHIIYAFLNPDRTFQFNIDEVKAAQLRTFTATLHAKSLKVLFAVGGGGDSTAGLLSFMASDRTSRDLFINSSISVARRLGFDGIDLDWEYPQNPTEMENLGTLLKEWRDAVTKDANLTRRPALLLTAAVYYMTTISGPPFMIRSYPVSTMSANLDFINVMTYDYHGSWEPNATGAFAALQDKNNSVSCTEAGIKSWIDAKMPPEKLIMGLPLYGRTWTLVDPTRADGIGAPANGVGPGTDGVMPYAEVVPYIINRVKKVEYDEGTVSVYLVAGSEWISYDDPMSVSAKVKYAKGRGLGGYFFWQVAGDYQWTLSQTASDSWNSLQEI